MPDHELWLTRRAAAGDQHAFKVLLERNGGQLLALAANFAQPDAEVDDCVQILREELWKRIGGFDPGRSTFGTYAHMVARQALGADWRRRRAGSRWAPQRPASLDALIADDWERPAPSWSLGADPLAVVLWRETLRESVQALTAMQLAAVNLYMRTDGIGAPRAVVDSMYRARRATAPLRLV